jgi:hypothetical protein
MMQMVIKWWEQQKRNYHSIREERVFSCQVVNKCKSRQWYNYGQTTRRVSDRNGRLAAVAVESWPRLVENICLRFQFWIAVEVVESSPWSNAFSITSRIAINFLELRRHPYAELFADYNRGGRNYYFFK